MSLIVEALKAVDGRFEPLWPHEERMTRTRRDLFGTDEPFDLAGILEAHSDDFGPGLWKVRVFYDEVIRAVEASLYVPRSYESAALVDGGGSEYAYKAEDRTELDALGEKATELGADTALIVSGGLVSDFLHANAVFFDGSGWFTPSHPLLKGTRRARLLAEGRIRKMSIRTVDLKRFEAIGPINAMLDLEDVVMSIDSIVNLSELGAIG